MRHCATVKIINKKGLHARASAKIVEASARFQSHITVSKGGQTVDGRSIMGLMMLAAAPGLIRWSCGGARFRRSAS